MTKDIFHVWPEFLSDIPVFNSIRHSPSLGRSPKQSEPARNSWALVISDSSHLDLNLETLEEEEQAIEQGRQQHGSLQVQDSQSSASNSLGDSFQFFDIINDL
jgi:hypothetical protein